MVKRTECRTTGSGITKHTETITVLDLTEPPTKAERAELVAKINAAAARPLWDKHSLVAQCRGALERIKATLPPEHEDCDFRPHEDFGWYYARLILLDKLVQRDVAKGDAAMAAYNAAEFGSLLSELQIKLVWEPDAIAGRASRDGAKRPCCKGNVARHDRQAGAPARGVCDLSGSHWRRARAAARGQGCGIFGQAG